MITCKIKKEYKNFSLDVDFIMQENHIGLLGASGSGKSLTLKSIAGLIRPDSGQIIIDGRTLFDSEKNINIRPQDRKIGYLFQDYALFPNFTVEENIRLGLRENKKRDISQNLKDMHIYNIRNKYPNTISGGEKQRTALCRVLLNNPDIILLDEPFSALDGFLKSSIEAEVSRILLENDIKTILVSHNKDEVYRMSESIISINKGKSYRKKKRAEFFTNPSTVTEAKLIGINNFSEIKKIDNNKFFANDWGLEFYYNNYPKNKILAIIDDSIKISSKEDGDCSFILEDYFVIENIDSYTIIYNKDKNKYKDLKIKVNKYEFESLKDQVLYASIDSSALKFVDYR
ncbi:sulfate/molybdate ABC transporter ATP-binding protein [uncultured Anaerococcus sp.]|uniref:sulfate/molybdate ABC transporter ATP-binding protein n=1 Tax=uncultured Anaerococcus sp. TaxID=293428 RepID=UPI00260922FA|nr:ATP-binding cassette domain-containing protein [uncultured Anaerococcus sp.]